MADGAIVVKEGYDDEAGAWVGSLTAMMKVYGYDPDRDDWFWASLDPETGTASSSGKLEGRYGCHEAGKDYVLSTTW